MTMTEVTYPGVYLEEIVGFALSISPEATAVPVIAMPASVASSPMGDNSARDDAVEGEGNEDGENRGDVSIGNVANGENGGGIDNKGNEGIKDDAATAPPRIASWLEFLRFVERPFDSDNLLDVSVRAYFENGGGPCYLVPAADLEAVVPTLHDATLIVAAGNDIGTAVTNLCGEKMLRFAIMDAPSKDQRPDITNISESAHAAAYYPPLKASWTNLLVPASAAVAGVYCSVDRERGVWKAPANVALRGGLKPSVPISNDLQGEFNVGMATAINMIRSFRGADAVVWGARTLKADEDSWRYVPVRRLFDAVERDLRDAMRGAVFEINAAPTWERVRGAIDNYLHRLWRDGGLMGSKADEAYFVQVGRNITMSDADIAQGKMIVKVGLAAVRPAEFIILQFTQDVIPA